MTHSQTKQPAGRNQQAKCAPTKARRSPLRNKLQSSTCTNLTATAPDEDAMQQQETSNNNNAAAPWDNDEDDFILVFPSGRSRSSEGQTSGCGIAKLLRPRTKRPIITQLNMPTRSLLPPILVNDDVVGNNNDDAPKQGPEDHPPRLLFSDLSTATADHGETLSMTRTTDTSRGLQCSSAALLFTPRPNKPRQLVLGPTTSATRPNTPDSCSLLLPSF